MADDTQRDVEPTPLPARQGAHARARLRREAHGLDHLVGVARRRVVAGRGAHGLRDGELRLVARVLRDDAQARPPGPPGPGGVLAEHADVAAVAVPEPLEDLDRRRLARAVGAEDGDDLTRREVEVEAVDRLLGAVALGQAADADGLAGGRARPDGAGGAAPSAGVGRRGSRGGGRRRGHASSLAPGAGPAGASDDGTRGPPIGGRQASARAVERVRRRWFDPRPRVAYSCPSVVDARQDRTRPSGVVRAWRQGRRARRVVAQLVAQRSPKPQVAGSSPVYPASVIPRGAARSGAIRMTPERQESVPWVRRRQVARPRRERETG